MTNEEKNEKENEEKRKKEPVKIEPDSRLKREFYNLK